MCVGWTTLSVVRVEVVDGPSCRYLAGYPDLSEPVRNVPDAAMIHGCVGDVHDEEMNNERNRRRSGRISKS